MVTRYKDRSTFTIHALGSVTLLSQTDHPNASPFQGVLTKIDEPSDKPPNGSHGHRVLIPKSVAEHALSTLLGMAVNFTNNLKGHEAQQKVGVITSATIHGRDIVLGGHLYAKDFPKVVQALRAKSQGGDLGMSFEISDVTVDDPSADIWVLRALVFTGAAILERTAAAYESTSFIAASAERKNKEQKMKELRKLRHQAAGVIGDLEQIRLDIAAMEEDEEDEEAMGKRHAEETAAIDAADEDALAAMGKRHKEEMAALKSPQTVDDDARTRKPGTGAKTFPTDARNYEGQGEDTKTILAELASMQTQLAAMGGMEPGMPTGGMNSMEMMKGMLQKVMSMLMKNNEGMVPDDTGLMGPDHEDEPEDIAMLKRLKESVRAMETKIASQGKGMAAQAGNVTDLQVYRAITELEQRFGAMEAAQELITDTMKQMNKLLTDTVATQKKLATDSGGVRRLEDGKPAPARRSHAMAASVAGDTVIDKFAAMYAEKEEVTVKDVEKDLDDKGITDPIARMAAKHALGEKLVG